MILTVSLLNTSEEALTENWGTVAKTAAVAFVYYWDERKLSQTIHLCTEAEISAVGTFRRKRSITKKVHALASFWTEQRNIAIPMSPWICEDCRSIFAQNPAAYSVKLIFPDHAEFFVTWFLLMELCGIKGGLSYSINSNLMRWEPWKAQDWAHELYTKFFTETLSTENKEVFGKTAIAFLSEISPNYF